MAAGEMERTSYGCGDIANGAIAMEEALFGRHPCRRGLGSGGGPRQWTTSVLCRKWRRRTMPSRLNATINPVGRGYVINNLPMYLVRHPDKDEDKKKVSSFFLSFDAATIATPTDVAPADAAETMSKDGLRTGYRGLTRFQCTADRGG